jgi:hypothetical protein
LAQVELGVNQEVAKWLSKSAFAIQFGLQAFQPTQDIGAIFLRCDPAWQAHKQMPIRMMTQFIFAQVG